MTSNRRNLLHIPKPLICIYTNQNRNEFAIGLEKDENFRAITKVGESYTRFVDAYDQIINDESEVDWKLGLKRWIQAAFFSSPSLTDPNYIQNQGTNLDTTIEIKEPSSQSSFIKRILIVDDDPDLTLTFKAGLDGYYYDNKKRFEVYTYNDPLLVLTQFKPHFYDLLLTDIYMPNMNGFQLCEKILELDVNIRVCFMSAFVVNIQALRELYSNVNLGCYIEKPVTIKYLIKRLSAELD